MDEVVFQREKLRRELLNALELLDKAAHEYDAEEAVPVQDVVVILACYAVNETMGVYSGAVKTHAENLGVPTSKPEWGDK